MAKATVTPVDRALVALIKAVDDIDSAFASGERERCPFCPADFQVEHKADCELLALHDALMGYYDAAYKAEKKQSDVR